MFNYLFLWKMEQTSNLHLVFVIVYENDCLMILLAFRNNSASMIAFNFVQK